MALLDAALAFALTLVALAGVTTMIVELGHRILQLKARQFDRMVRDLVAAEIVPFAVRKFLVDQEKQPGGLAPAIEAVIVGTLGAAKPVANMSDAELRKLLPALTDAKFEAAQDWVREAIARLLANASVPEAVRTGVLRKVEEMDTNVLLERLGKLEVFKDLKAKGGQALADAVARIEASYEEIAAGARDFFTRRAKVVSLVVGVALAFAVNADGYRIFRLYLKEPATAQRIVKQQDKLVANWKAAQADLDKTLAALKARTPAAEGAPAKAAADKDVQAIRDRLRAIDAHIGALKPLGLPIGYAAREPKPPDTAWIVHWVPWALSVLITGLLIGLGGPFWYDIAIKLSQAREIIRGSGSAIPVSTGRAARAAASGQVSLLTGRPVSGFVGLGTGGGPAQSRPPHPRNVTAFKGTTPLSEKA